MAAKLIKPYPGWIIKTWKSGDLQSLVELLESCRTGERILMSISGDSQSIEVTYREREKHEMIAPPSQGSVSHKGVWLQSVGSHETDPFEDRP